MTTETTGTHVNDLPIPERLNWLLGGIGRVIGASEVVRKRLVDWALLSLAWNRLGMAVKRLSALYEKYRAGTLKPTRVRPSRKGEARPSRPRPLPLEPRRAGWLTLMVPECSWGGGSLLMMLEHPDIVAIITDVPQARRILRPMCHLFADGSRIPAILKLPRRPRPAKPKARNQRKRKPRPLARIDYSRELYGMHRVPPDASWGLAPAKSKKRS